MSLKRGDLVLISLDPTKGSEIKKTRPAVIISNNVANEFSSLVTILPVTSQRVEKAYPFEVRLDNKNSPLLKKSKIKCDQIRAADKMRIVKKLGSLSVKTIKEIEKALILHLSINLNHFFI